MTTAPHDPLPARRVPLLALFAGLATVATLFTLGSLVGGVGSITRDLGRARSITARTADVQRDLLVFHRQVVRLAIGGTVVEAERRRAEALGRLRGLEVRAAGPTQADQQLVEDLSAVERGLRRIELRPLRPGRAGARPALARVDAELTAQERAVLALRRRGDRRFAAVTSHAVSAKSSAQRLVAGLIVLNLLLIGAWAVRLRRRSRDDLRVAYRAARRSERRFRSLVQDSLDLTILADPSGVITYASPAAEPLTGRTPEDLVGLDLEVLAVAEDRPALARMLEALLDAPEGRERIEFRTLDHSGTVRHLDAGAANHLGDPAVRALVLNVRDVTRRRRLEAQLAHLAFHDPLTGLPNRARLLERLEQAVAVGGTMALALIDLDEFKGVNDGLGHAAGDRMLEAVAARLEACVEPHDLVARLGGDEFVVLAAGTPDRAAAEALAARIVAALEPPFRSGSGILPGGASVGVVFTRAEGQETERLLRDADLAMYAAKRAGKGTWTVFEPSMHDAAAEELELRAALQRAVEQEQLVLDYQPIVEARTRRITGFEALVRWDHPEWGRLGPERFIAIAEQTGMIAPLGWWVLREATAAAQRFRAQAHRPDLTISVNLSRASSTTGRRRASCARRSRRPACRRRTSSSRSPRASSWPTRGRPSPAWRRCARSAPSSPSTTSARASRRCPTSSGSRSTCSRSTGRSSRSWGRPRQRLPGRHGRRAGADRRPAHGRRGRGDRGSARGRARAGRRPRPGLPVLAPGARGPGARPARHPRQRPGGGAAMTSNR